MSLPPLAANAWLRWDALSRLLPRDARTVLEIGCGGGGFGARLSVGRDYLGVEPDEQSARTARGRVTAAGSGGEVRTGMVDDAVEADRTFDLVCAFEVLEHLEDDAAALSEWIARVRPGGSLAISTPAFQDRYAAWDEVVGHYRRYDPDQLRDLLRTAGLIDVQVLVYGAPLGYPLEMARNAIGRRRLQKTGAAGASPGGAAASSVSAATRVSVDPETMQQLTAVSGRLFQPSATLGVLTRVGTAPFRAVQRRLPTSGTGLVAVGRRPPTASPSTTQ